MFDSESHCAPGNQEQNGRIKIGTLAQRRDDDHSVARVCGSINSPEAKAKVLEAEHWVRVNARRAQLEQLEHSLTELAAHLDAAMYRWLELLREFDEAEGWCGNGIKSLAHWLNWKCGLRLATARERVRVARALKDLPQTSSAFRDGRISYSKVRAITRTATPFNEEVFLNIAFHGTASHVEQSVYVWRREQRREALEKDNRRHAMRELDWYVDIDGCVVVKARLTPEQGAMVKQAIEAVMAQIDAERTDVPAETFASYRPTPEESHPITARRADALARLAERWLAGEETAAGTTADRFVVNLHTDIQTLKADGTGAESELEGSGNVSAETSRRLSCDAGRVYWLNRGKDGRPGVEPLSVGRKTRTVPASIRKALERRDRGCRYPGCTCRRWVDAHHIHHWADGGATHIDNLALLCRHHHRLVHEGGFGLRRTLEGELIFTDPDGERIPDVGQPRFRGNVSALIGANQRRGIDITPRTCIPEWYGESMDTGILADVLHYIERNPVPRIRPEDQK